MNKFISQLKGAQVLLFQEKVVIGEVSAPLIDPHNLSLIGFELNTTQQNAPSYITPLQIKGYGQGFILVESLESLSEADDIIKIKNLLGHEAHLLGSRVYTESQQYLGRVEDATLDLKHTILAKLYVGQRFPLNIVGEQKIIDRKQIVKVLPKKIIVTDLKSRASKPIIELQNKANLEIN